MEAINVNSKDYTKTTMAKIKERDFTCGEYLFAWGIELEKPKNLWVTGGFIDLNKKFFMKVKNPYQVLAAIATKKKIEIEIGKDEDLIRFELDFYRENIRFCEKLDVDIV